MHKEKRQYARSPSIFDLKVTDRDTLLVIGYLLDISSGGLGVISDDPIGTDRLFRLELTVPLDEKHPDVIAFDAKSIWCQKAPQLELYHTGFQFMKLSDRANEALEALRRDDFLMTVAGTR